MHERPWGIRFAAVGVWCMASLTWGSIGHHLMGLPDLGPALAIAVAVAVVALPLGGGARGVAHRSPSNLDENLRADRKSAA